MEKENLSWFNGPVSHIHMRMPGEVNNTSSRERFQFTQETGLHYLQKLFKKSNVRITDTNHAMLSFDNLDNLVMPSFEEKQIWKEKIINQASDETIKRITEIRNNSDGNIIIGIEADIIDFQGNLSLNDECLKQIDFTIASFHRFIWTIFSDKKYFLPKELIQSYLGALDNPLVCVLGHPTRLSSKLLYPLKSKDFLPVIKKMKTNRIAYEITILDDLSSKKEDLNLEVIQMCNNLGVPLILSFDFHHLQEIDFLKDLSLENNENIESNFASFFDKNRDVHFRIFRRLIKNIEILKNLGIKKESVVNNSDHDFDRWLNDRKSFLNH